MRRADRSSGFTLLEVLAAVAVLGLVYSVLATAAIEGLRAEGDSGRRIRASLLADERIADIEAQVSMGQTPEIGTAETEEDEFVVRTEVSPLDPGIAETKASKRAKDRLDRAVGARPKGGKAEAGTLLHPAGASNQPLLRRIDLEVAWNEGDSARSVRRTTYGIDMVAAAPLIEQLVAAAEAERSQESQTSKAPTKAEQTTGAASTTKSSRSSAKSGTSGSSTSGRSSGRSSRSSILPGADPGASGDER